MNRFPIPLIDAIPDVAGVFTGRGEPARPEPLSLLPLLGPAGPHRLAILRQVHSNRCLIVRDSDFPAGRSLHVAGDGDALVTSDPGIALGVATADCLPLLVVDPRAHVMAVVHAGWRGTLSGVLESTLAIMRDDFGADCSRVLIGAGPAAGSCCYEVGSEVVGAFTASRPEQAAAIFTPTSDGRARLDLIEANRLQALSMGVPAAGFATAGVCTICRPAVTHSYRREGPAAGRMWVVGALSPLRSS